MEKLSSNLKDGVISNYTKLIIEDNYDLFVQKMINNKEMAYFNNNFILSFCIHTNKIDFFKFLFLNFYKDNKYYIEYYTLFFLNIDNINFLKFLLNEVYDNSFDSFKNVNTKKYFFIGEAIFDNFKFAVENGLTLNRYLITSLIKSQIINKNKKFLDFLLNLNEAEYFFHRLSHIFDFDKIEFSIELIRKLINHEKFTNDNFNFFLSKIFILGNFEHFKEVIKFESKYKIDKKCLFRFFISSNKKYKERMLILEFIIKKYNVKKIFKDLDMEVELIDNQHIINLINKKNNLISF